MLFAFSVKAQVLTYSFTDPCTKEVTFFSIPIQGTTVIFFLNQSRSFSAADVASGAFAAWTNQVYADYRRVSPCSVQSSGVIRNQINSQIIGNVVSSVVSSISSSAMASSMSSGGSVSSGSSGGGDDNASKGKSGSDSKKKSESSGSSGSSNGSSSSSTSTGNSGGSTGGGSSSSSGSTSGGSSSSGSTTGGNSGGGNGNSSEGDKGGETVATTTMNNDAHTDKGSEGGSESGGGGGGKKGGGGGGARSNPMIVSSDLTSAQNLDQSFTGIVNIGMSQSSLSGTSSWGATAMVWFNLKQYALSGRWTNIRMTKDRKLKFIHNVSLTGAYSFGNVFGFLGYSGIMNAGKWGITGFNVSAAATKTPDDDNLFVSPSITAFYTKPFTLAKKRITVSPEIYIISTPLVYSSVDRVTVTDRTFSGFLGTGFDYQITKRFKFNFNYKANVSTNKDFPILSFFLIGSKINL